MSRDSAILFSTIGKQLTDAYFELEWCEISHPARLIWESEAGCPCEKADLDCDGTVGLGDLGIISLDWLEE